MSGFLAPTPAPVLASSTSSAHLAPRVALETQPVAFPGRPEHPLLRAGKAPHTKGEGWRRLRMASELRDLNRPMECSPPGYSVYGILQARILEWVAMPPPGDLPDQGSNLHVSCLLH